MSEEWVDPFWEQDSSFPKPKDGMPRCPSCGDKHTIIRGWLHHCKPKSPSMFRIDVGLKCTHCAMVWYHGVRTTQEHFRGHGHQFNRRKEQLYMPDGSAETIS